MKQETPGSPPGAVVFATIWLAVITVFAIGGAMQGAGWSVQRVAALMTGQ